MAGSIELLVHGQKPSSFLFFLEKIGLIRWKNYVEVYSIIWEEHQTGRWPVWCSCYWSTRTRTNNITPSFHLSRSCWILILLGPFARFRFYPSSPSFVENEVSLDSPCPRMVIVKFPVPLRPRNSPRSSRESGKELTQ